jgi:hypothetical protein
MKDLYGISFAGGTGKNLLQLFIINIYLRRRKEITKYL